MRKVLSLVLVLTLVLGSFSMAFAADTTAAGLSDIAGNVNEDAIQVSYDLGIVTGNPDGTFQPEKAVTRAEFAAMITRAMAIPQSALAGYAQTSFKDTVGYSWAVPYLAFCNSKGIMLGDGAGNAMPGRTITVNEAMTMALRAIGYTSNSSELVGAWPANYVTLAQNLELYDDVASATTVNKASAAQIIYNVLDENIVAVNSDGKTEDVEKDGDTVSLLTTGLGCDKDNGGYNYVFTKTKADTAVINATKYIGALVKSYSKDGDVVAIAEVNSTFLTGSYDAGDKEFSVGDVTYNLAVADIDYSKVVDFTDGDKATSAPEQFENSVFTTNAALSAAALDALNTVTIAADVSGKTIKEVYSVNDWVAETAFQFEADMLDDTKLNGYKFVEDDDENIDAKSYALNGAASLDKIAEDSVVEVYLATPGDEDSDIVKVNVGTEKVTGRITVEDDGDYTIGGKVYSIADSFAADLDDLTDQSLGDKGTAYLNFDGDIALWEVEDADSDNYAVVADTLTDVGRDSTIVLLDKTGAEKEYVLTDDVLDGTEFTTSAGIASVGALAIGDLVTFSLDKDGDIDAITALDYTDADVDTDQVNKGRTLFGNVKLDSGVIVFTFDGATYDAADSGFSVITLANVEIEKDLVNTAYYQDGSSIAVLMIQDKYTGSEAKYAVLNSSKNSYNADDDKVMLVKGFVAGKEYTAYSADRDIAVLDEPFAPAMTNIYKLTVDANGVVTDAELTTGEAINPVTGYIYDKDGSYLIKVDKNAATSGAINDDANTVWLTIDPNAVVYSYDTSDAAAGDDAWSAAKLTDIKKGTNSIDATKVTLYQLDDDSEVYDLIVIDNDAE